MEAVAEGCFRMAVVAECRCYMAAVVFHCHMAVADILEDNLGKEAGFAVDFVGFVHLADLVGLAVGNSFAGYIPGMGQLVEMEQGLGFPVRFFYGALPL